MNALFMLWLRLPLSMPCMLCRAAVGIGSGPVVSIVPVAGVLVGRTSRGSIAEAASETEAEAAAGTATSSGGNASTSNAAI